jgi:hypothetical protein
MASIYDKALKRKDFSGAVSSNSKEQDTASPSSPQSKEDAADIGKIVQLCSADANSVSMMISFFFALYVWKFLHIRY